MPTVWPNAGTLAQITSAANRKPIRAEPPSMVPPGQRMSDGADRNIVAGAGSRTPAGGGSGGAAEQVRALEGARQVQEARHVVHGHELDHLRQHRAHSRRDGLETL